MTENKNVSESVEIIEAVGVKDDQVVEGAIIEKVTTADQQAKTTVINNYVSVPASSNTVGLVGFILSLVGLFGSWIPFIGGLAWLIGTILSIIGLFKAPRGFAIAGTIISLIGLIVLIAIVGIFAVVAAGSY